jgi:hypothetical protein
VICLDAFAVDLEIVFAARNARVGRGTGIVLSPRDKVVRCISACRKIGGVEWRGMLLASSMTSTGEVEVG